MHTVEIYILSRYAYSRDMHTLEICILSRYAYFISSFKILEVLIEPFIAVE